MKTNLKKQKAKISDAELENIGADLTDKIAKGHKYRFVGRVGRFTPMKKGTGGGILYRGANDKYYAATGTTGYRWMESEVVKQLNKEDDIDRTYYDEMLNKAVDAISAYGDFEWFASEDDSYIPENESTPPWFMPCGRETCKGCENLNDDQFHYDCSLGYDISEYIFKKEQINND